MINKPPYKSPDGGAYAFVTREEIEKTKESNIAPVWALWMVGIAYRLLAERDAALKFGEEAFLRGYHWGRSPLRGVASEEFNQELLVQEFHDGVARILEGK